MADIGIGQKAGKSMVWEIHHADRREGHTYILLYFLGPDYALTLPLAVELTCYIHTYCTGMGDAPCANNVPRADVAGSRNIMLKRSKADLFSINTDF
jgi:hypothetical protein